jgi:DNA polymerase (family 10)
MAADNARIAELLRQYAAALVIEGGDRFKINAYRRAASTIETSDVDVAQTVVDGGDLTELPGIGKGIAATITEIVKSGHFSRLEKSVAELTPEMAELATRPALDPKKVQRIYKKLKINSLDELRASLESGQIREVMGGPLEFHVRQGLEDRPRILLPAAERLAEAIETFLRAQTGVESVTAVGSLRRKEETIGELDFLVASERAASTTFKAFVKFSAVKTVGTQTKTDAEFVLSSGSVVRLACCKPEEWGLELARRSGSAGHIEALEQRAGERKLKLTGRGLAAKEIDATDEHAVFTGLGLKFIEPELREGRGEIEAAAADALPELVTTDDFRGDLHMHTTASDGSASIVEMARAAQARGYRYIAITDHSQSLKFTNGLTEDRLRAHCRAIDEANEQLKDFRIFKSSEVDILEDGSLDYSQEMLAELDFTICSIHSKFGLNREKQTERILRAMDNPYFGILGHATGRLLLRREGYELDMERIVRHAAEVDCFFEINANPNRLDLSDTHAKLAKEAGILIAVNTDAHSPEELDNLPYGVNQARRAWLTAGDVLNTRPAKELLKLLHRRR